jgi:membrane protease YdiL (CAAX protease family)
MNWRKIILFLIIAFTISWITAGIIHFTDIEFGSFTSIVLMALFYMASPAISVVIVQKVIYKSSLQEYGMVWKGMKWKWLLITIGISIFFVLGTLGLTGLLGNVMGIDEVGVIDFSQEGFNSKIIGVVNEAVEQSNFELNIDIEERLKNNPIPFSPYIVLVIILVSGIIAAFTINLPFMFGEELGWRGLLLRETQQMGFIKSNLFIGFVWGVWHAPLILMGHNYPEYPVVGVFMMILFTTAMSFPFAYCRLKTKSILAPCILHGMINGTAGGIIYFIHGGHSLIIGLVGLIGIVVVALLTFLIVLLDKKFTTNYKVLVP